MFSQWYDSLDRYSVCSKGLLDKSYGRLLSRLFELRQSGDYDDLYDATEDEVVPYIDKIFQFIQDMEKLIVFKG